MHYVLTIALLALVPASFWMGYLVYSKGIDAGARLKGHEGSVTHPEPILPFDQQETA